VSVDLATRSGGLAWMANDRLNRVLRLSGPVTVVALDGPALSDASAGWTCGKIAGHPSWQMTSPLSSSSPSSPAPFCSSTPSSFFRFLR
jgi:hypothetical protein